MFPRLREALGLTAEPVAVLWADKAPEGALGFKKGAERGCMVPLVKQAAFNGRVVALGRDNYGCPGGGYYLGFTRERDPHRFRYFLSTGIPGVIEGEGYKKSPELVDEVMKLNTDQYLPASGNYCVFKPVSLLSPEDEPEVVFFLVNPDQLSALVVLANYDLPGNDGVAALFGSGCSSLVLYPRLERLGKQRGIIGLTDVTVRKFLPPEILSFAVPYERGLEMEANVPASFLERKVWQGIQQRLNP
ncbi:MAG: DUF169 domain-containing protein [Bacillota bacterium]|nr:DUF169 domain-containing protein [Bacillota bacterium]